MSVLVPYEQEVVDALAGRFLSPEDLAALQRDGTLISLNHTGNGYFLTVKHPSVPTERVVGDAPLLAGRAPGISCGFVVFLENGELTLECHSWDGTDVPADIRSRDLLIERV